MNVKILPLLIIIFFSLAPLEPIAGNSLAAGQKTASQWYPFVLTDTLNDASSANIGKLVLDSPAGKHGFLRITKGHFAFSDKTPIQLWGTNLAYGLCFPSKQQARLIADRIAFFGFNAVRLHHMDSTFEPRGIFTDIAPLAQDPQLKPTGTLSPDQLDRLDYLVFLLKERGIYINMNLLVSRRFTDADGLKTARQISIAAKPVSIFDTRLIDLQKDYATRLLTHLNPYTGLRYNEDPAIAMLEIANENSLLNSWNVDALNNFTPEDAPTLPACYVEELDRRWNEWLKTTYTTTEAVKKAWRSNNSTSTRFDFQRPLYRDLPKLAAQESADISRFYHDVQSSYFSTMTRFLKKDLLIKVPITGMGGITSASDIPTLDTSDFIDVHAYWDHPAFPNHDWDTNDFTINNTSMLVNNDLGIIGSIISLTQSVPTGTPITITEWDHIYPSIYAYETPALMATKAKQLAWDGVFHFNFSENANIPDSFHTIPFFFQSASNPQKSILLSIGAFILNKIPKADLQQQITDGIHRIISPRVQGAAGALSSQPINLPAISINSQNNTAIFVISLDEQPITASRHLLLTIAGQTKNTDSGWINGQFRWGTGPILLENISADIRIRNPNHLQAFRLDASGTRSTALKTSFNNGIIGFSTAAAASPWIELLTE